MRGSVQRVIYVSALDEIEPFDPSFEHVYLGSEFCQRQLPSQREMRGLLEFSQRHGVGFSLVTSFLNDEGVARAGKLLRMLDEGTEVIFNDWGLLHSITEQRLVPVVGRLLIKIKRDPRLGGADLAREELAAYLRSSNLAQPSFQQFLERHGVQRAELDNVQQGWALDLPATIKTSLYYPFVYASVTRRCSLLFSEPDDSGALRDGRCVKHCDDFVIRSSIALLEDRNEERVEQYHHGGSLCFLNEEMPSEADLERWNTDRLVYVAGRMTRALPE